jgi:hypothetical protein
MCIIGHHLFFVSKEPQDSTCKSWSVSFARPLPKFKLDLKAESTVLATVIDSRAPQMQSRFLQFFRLWARPMPSIHDPTAAGHLYSPCGTPAQPRREQPSWGPFMDGKVTHFSAWCLVLAGMCGRRNILAPVVLLRAAAVRSCSRRS